MTDRASDRSRTLVARVGARVCALPLTHVIETMRPLPVEPIASLPSFLRGLSIIRGLPTPVVDLAIVLGTASDVAGRFVTIRLGNRQVALIVDAVLGVRDLELSTTQELPPLLREASKDVLEAIGTLDMQFLVVLRAGWELPEQVWRALTVQEGPR